MTSKTILVLAIATAFIAGILTTGTLVFADEKTLVERCDKQAGKDNFKELVCSALFELQNQIDNISQGVQVDQQGNTVLSNDLEVTGDTRLGDTTISSDLIIGPTNIDSETGDVDVGGDLNVIGETFLDDTTISTTLTVGTTTIDDATSNVDVGGDLLCNGCIDSSDIADGTIVLADLFFDTATQAELDAKNVDDADADPTNELQQLIIVNKVLNFNVPPLTTIQKNLFCDSGFAVTGGGFSGINPVFDFVVVNIPIGSNPPTGWSLAVKNSSTSLTTSPFLHVVCAKLQ